MPPGVHQKFETAPYLPATPAHETAPPGATPTANSIHEQLRALIAGRDCLVDTPFQKELGERWASQTRSTEFTVSIFAESLVLESTYYILSAKRREQEQRIAWRALERSHPHGNPTLPAHGILCGHETFWLYARCPTSFVRVPLLRSVALLETTPGNHFTAAPATVSVRRSDTLQPILFNHETSPAVYERVGGLLGQLAAQNTPRTDASTVPTVQRPITLFVSRTPPTFPLAA